MSENRGPSPSDASALLHRRQFVLGRAPIKYRRDWVSHELGKNLYLSHCPSLPVRGTADRDGMSWYVLGVAVQSEGAAPDPDEQVKGARTGEVPDLYTRWAGRWIAVTGEELHLDASGLLGCYYLDAETLASDDSLVWASSSASLLAELAGTRVGLEDSRRPTHGRGLDWVPPPHSRFGAVRRLLPSQILNLHSRAVRPRPLVETLARGSSYEETVTQLQEYLVTVLRRLGSTYSKVWLATTSGLDTRVLLAGCRAANLTVRTYTQDRDGLSVGDWLLSSRLSRLLGAEYRFVRAGPFSPTLAALYDNHVAAHAADADRTFVAKGQWGFPEPGSLVLRGGCFEIGRCYMWHSFGGIGDSVALPSASGLAAAFGETGDSGRSVVQGLAAWRSWVEKTPDPDVDWRDRFYHEQRLAGWLSAIEQSLDLLPIEHIHPMNSSHAFGLLLSVPPRDRIKGALQADMIRTMAPEFLSIPINPPLESFGPAIRLWWNFRQDSLYPLRWLARKSKRALRRVRSKSARP